MKIKIDKKILCDCLKKIAPIATLNRAGLVQSNLFLKTQGNDLIITVSNLSTDVKAVCVCEVEKEGSALVSALKFSTICETFKKEITLDIKGSELILSEDSTKIKMPLCLDEYPKINFEINSDNYFTISGSALKSGINKTINFTDKVTSITSGVNFNVKNNILKICATNSYCLSCINTHITYEGDVDFTLPKEVLKILSKCFDDENIKIYSVNNKVKFESENLALIATRLAGAYPKYQPMFDKLLSDREAKSTLTIKKQDLEAVVKRVGVLAQINKPAIKFECQMLTKISYLDVFSDIVAAKYEGKEITVQLDFELLSKALSVLEQPEITFELSTGTSPVFIYENGLILLMAPIVAK